MRQSTFPLLCSLSLICCLLTGCMDNGPDDLDAFFENAGKDMQIKIKPLPDVKHYLSFEFNADGMLGDPFKSQSSHQQIGTMTPNFDRPKEPMETYPLESIKYVGMIERSNEAYALLQTPENNIMQVKSGNYVGQNFGQVTAIKENELVLNEVVQDAATGEWIEQETTVTLQE